VATFGKNQTTFNSQYSCNTATGFIIDYLSFHRIIQPHATTAANYLLQHHVRHILPPHLSCHSNTIIIDDYLFLSGQENSRPVL
jgi:hypothetical protein